MRLDSYINRLDEVLSHILVAHRQTDGRHNYIYNVYVNISVNDSKS
jgi:hypothetical protein